MQFIIVGAKIYVVQQSIFTLRFSANILVTDEATFSWDKFINLHNYLVWATSNRHATRPHSFQESSLLIWAGIVDDFHTGPYMLPHCLNLGSIPLAVRNAKWFQYDGTPHHFLNNVCNYLNSTFGFLWTDRGGQISLTARSLDLSSIDYFLQWHLKSLVYET